MGTIEERCAMAPTAKDRANCIAANNREHHDGPQGMKGEHHDGPQGEHHDGPQGNHNPAGAPGMTGGPGGHQDGPPDCSTIPEPEGRALCETSQARGTPPTAAECATMPTEEGKNNCMQHVGGTP
jgi:hypothetical protein